MSNVLMSQNRSSESDGSSGNKQNLSIITHSKYICENIFLIPTVNQVRRQPGTQGIRTQGNHPKFKEVQRKQK
jgi:hypothetical protein